MPYKIIVANFKTTKRRAFFQHYLEELKGLKQPFRQVVLCPPAPYFYLFQPFIENNPAFVLGAQDSSSVSDKPLTGDITPLMLQDYAISHVILGHSERCMHLKEAKGVIQKKIVQALAHQLKPIVCVGEPLDIKEAQKTHAYLINQLASLLPAHCPQVIIAYEPLWAIGTGKTPKAEEVQEVAQHIKDYATLKNIDVTVLYGGSVQEKNSQDFLALPAVDGLLVGSAALDPKALCKIANVR